MIFDLFKKKYFCRIKEESGNKKYEIISINFKDENLRIQHHEKTSGCDDGTKLYRFSEVEFIK